MAQTNSSIFEQKLRKEITDIAECPICTETMKDPRSLPCLHSFCLKCLVSYGKGKKEGDKLSCPVCRTDLILQSSNFNYLPVSHIINKIVDASKLSATSEQYCSVCWILKKEKPAGQYCVECGDRLCSDCANCHSAHKLTNGHKIVSLSEGYSKSDLSRMRANYCRVHNGETIKFYCYNCKITTCVVCYVSYHKEHKCSDVTKVADEMKNDIDAIAHVLKEQKLENQNILKQVCESEGDLLEREKMLRKSLKEKYTTILTKLDSDHKQITDRLVNLRSTRKQELENIRYSCNSEITSMNDIENLWEEIKANGNASDIVETAEGIRKRFVDIKSTHQKELPKQSRVCKPDYYKLDFLQSWTTHENLIGNLKEIRSSHESESARPKIEGTRPTPVQTTVGRQEDNFFADIRQILQYIFFADIRHILQYIQDNNIRGVAVIALSIFVVFIIATSLGPSRFLRR